MTFCQKWNANFIQYSKLIKFRDVTGATCNPFHLSTSLYIGKSFSAFHCQFEMLSDLLTPSSLHWVMLRERGRTQIRLLRCESRTLLAVPVGTKLETSLSLIFTICKMKMIIVPTLRRML